MKREFPLLITFFTGIILIIAFFIPHKPFSDFSDIVQNWTIIIFAFAIILGILNLVIINLKKLFKMAPGWGYSIVLLLGFLVTSVMGIGWGMKADSPFNFIFEYFYTPLSATMFALLAFFIASAAFRAFRAKSFEAFLLLLAAFIVMLGRVPLGNMIHQIASSIPFIGDFLGSYLNIPRWADWIMDIPNVAGQRAILLGAALGAISASLKILLGIERSYLGGE